MPGPIQTTGERIVHSSDPLNAEPPTARLRDSFITPQSLFYVRCHGDIPRIDPASYELRVEGRVATPLRLGLDELRRRFPLRRLVATLQCAGNRRADLNRVRPVAGDPWQPGAVGTAEWTGVSLAEILAEAGAAADAGHVAFASADQCHVAGKTFRYGVSIPRAKAAAPEVLLAVAMNGQDLRPEHGAPLRVVVPGYAGARSPKWLQAIRVQDEPWDGPIQAEEYKLFPADVSAETADPARGITIDALPVNSAICDPAPEAVLPAGQTTLRGYATASARRISRVDVSADGGRTWREAVLEDAGDPWRWTFWHAALDLPPGRHELAVRAWDEAGQTQPDRPEDVWNHRGYLCASWHRVPVLVR